MVVFVLLVLPTEKQLLRFQFYLFPHIIQCVMSRKLFWRCCFWLLGRTVRLSFSCFWVLPLACHVRMVVRLSCLPYVWSCWCFESVWLCWSIRLCCTRIPHPPFCGTVSYSCKNKTKKTVWGGGVMPLASPVEIPQAVHLHSRLEKKVN